MAMPGVFDLNEQHEDIDSKLIVSLERLAQALRVMVWEVAKQEGLSPIQAQVLIHLRYHQNCRLSDLAKRFDLTKATLSDAVKTLEAKALLERRTDLEDARASYLKLTSQGKKVVQSIERWAERAKGGLIGIDQKTKQETLLLVMQIIENLQNAGVMSVARMCTTCRFLVQEPSYYCRLLNKPLKV